MDLNPAAPRRDGCYLTGALRIRRVVETGRKSELVEKIVVTLIKNDEIWMVRVQLGLEPDQIVFHTIPSYTSIDDLDSGPGKKLVEYSLKSRRPRRGVG